MSVCGFIPFMLLCSSHRRMLSMQPCLLWGLSLGPATRLAYLCAVMQVTARRVHLCNLWRLSELAAADADAEPAAAAGTAAPGNGGTPPAGYKRHASWAHLPGMEDRISEALARQRFLRPRCERVLIGF